MIEIDARIRLRPIRIGFLVRPNDLESVRKIMRYCTAVWGGIYNPIIPVFRNPPKHWINGSFDRVRGIAVAKGYIRFFEPDVYVEAEKGLLELVGLGAVRDQLSVYPDVLALSELLKAEKHRDWCEPAFGLNIQDVHAHLYRTDQQFAKRDRRESIVVESDGGSGVSELIFGVFPTQRSVRYIERGYHDVFQPTKLSANPASWEKAFKESAITPLRVTGYGLDLQRSWHHDSIIFVFDPRRATDLIDAWNLRLEPHPVVPVPADWFEFLGDSIFGMIKSEHRRLQGNPNNVMHNATIEFSRSISRLQAESLIKTLKPGLPAGALSVKFWRNRIWDNHREDYQPRHSRMLVTADERGAKLQINESEGLRATFQTLSPEFARRYGGRHHRWVNALRLSSQSHPVATVLPFNATDPNWPRLGMGRDRVLVGSEGWIFTEQLKDSTQWLELQSHEAAISGTLKRLGIEAQLSEPGHIAKQMLDHLGGLWEVYLLADLETLVLLNKMAGGLRKRSTETESIEETFELRAAPIKEWIDLLERRKSARRLPALKLEYLTSKNVIRLGLETDCPHCKAKNWNGLESVKYELTCERCLKDYPFPQAGLRDQNRNWRYRVVGPFSVPDYGRGSYAALLALRLIGGFNSSFDEITVATAMTLEFDGRRVEVDFLALRSDERYDFVASPEIVIGEAKSVGKGQLIKPRDLAQLKALAAKLPGAIIVIAVLRDHFLPIEKRILEPFVKWGRRLKPDGEQANPVVLLTSNELLFDHFLSATWKSIGGEHAKFANYDHTRSMRSLADATQQLYLGLPSFDAWHRSQWEKKLKRQKRGRETRNGSAALDT